MKTILKDSLQKLDFVVWFITLLFFTISSIIMWWDLIKSFSWGSWIIILMFFVWFSIEIILSALKNVKWLWTITWFITNWPEALVLIVWLISWNILFAASTPLGSNVMNPILLFIWLIITWYILKLSDFKNKYFFLSSFILSAIIASIFFFIDEKFYIYWVILSLIITISLFLKKFTHEKIIIEDWKTNKLFLPLWIIILLIAWYFLDPVVSFTAEASKSPKWVIWFVVLATLTSWPEFKSVLALLKRNRLQDAFINIFVSNLTNIWLAIIWVSYWLFK